MYILFCLPFLQKEQKNVLNLEDNKSNFGGGFVLRDVTLALDALIEPSCNRTEVESEVICVFKLPLVGTDLLSAVFGLMRIGKQILTLSAPLWLQMADAGTPGRAQSFRSQIESEKEDLHDSGFLLQL